MFRSLKSAPLRWLPISSLVTKKVGVTGQDLATARAMAEKLRKEHEQALEEQKQLASALATKADSAEVAANVAAARAEAATKVAEVQKDSDTKITSVSGDVKTVASNLETTRQDLAASRRDLVDVKTVLSDQIARNSSELATLRQKGEKDFFEFDIKKGEEKRHGARWGHPPGVARDGRQEAEIRHHHSSRRQQAREEGQTDQRTCPVPRWHRPASV